MCSARPALISLPPKRVLLYMGTASHVVYKLQNEHDLTMQLKFNQGGPSL